MSDIAEEIQLRLHKGGLVYLQRKKGASTWFVSVNGKICGILLGFGRMTEQRMNIVGERLSVPMFEFAETQIEDLRRLEGMQDVLTNQYLYCIDSTLYGEYRNKLVDFANDVAIATKIDVLKRKKAVEALQELGPIRRFVKKTLSP